MSRKGNQKLKLLYTLDILRKYSDEEHPLNAVAIAEKLMEKGIEAERKSIYDDIACLTDYGCDIVKSFGRNGGWFIGSREFEIPEIYLLSDAVRNADFISSKKTRELLKKLKNMLSESQMKMNFDTLYFGDFRKCSNEEIYYNIDTVRCAIEKKKQVRFSYYSRSLSADRTIVKNSRQMQISPYALCWQDDHYYVIGNYEKYDNLLNLRLDRMGKAEITDTASRPFSEVSEYKDFFDIADYTKKVFGMYTGELSEIELRCDKKISEQVLDRFGEKIFLKKVTDDEFSFSVKAAVSEALVTWIINYGSQIKVTKPEALKRMVTQRAKNVLRNYGENI